MTDSSASWEKFLHPATLKANLIAISLFITAYELFREQVVTKPRTFFSNGFDQNGLFIDEEYKTEVLSRSKSELHASLLWFEKMEAIDKADLATFDSIRRHRNELAHEPMQFLANANRNFDATKFQELVSLLSKIEKWWFVNFEAAIDSDMLPEGANAEDVIPGPIWSLQLMLNIALGSEPEEGYFYKAFRENKPKS